MTKTTEERITELLELHPKGRNIRQLEEALNTDGLREVLDTMEKNYEIGRTENGYYRSADKSGILRGRISIAKSGMGYLDQPDRESVKIDVNDQMYAMDGDEVIVICQPWQVYGQVVKITRHARTHLIGTYLRGARGLVFEPDDAKLKDRDIRILDYGDFTPVEGLKVYCEIEEYGYTLSVRVTRVIGHKDDPGTDILSILLDHDIDPEFPEDVMKQANSFPAEVTEEEIQGRTDLRDRTIVTIDGDGAKDFDDAVSVVKDGTGWILTVCIADVSHYVTEDSPLDIEAAKRGTSTYVTDRVVPMLPHVLSNGICSLNPHVDRLTITCEMKIASDGTTEDYKLYPSVIRSTERMTYHNVNLILEGDEALREKYAHLGTLFDDMKECADAIRGNRLRKGAVEFASDDAEIIVDENGHPKDIIPVNRGPAEKLIEDFMIAANCSVANFLKWQEIPAVYRIHEEPQARRIRDFIRISEAMGHKLVIGKSAIYPNEIQRYLDSVSDVKEYPVISNLLLRCMQKARYDVHCVGHFGLAEEEYLHFTSPIRRYPDLIVHRMLRRYSFEQNTDPVQHHEDEIRCEKYAETSSVRERNSQDAEYACEDRKKAEYMAERIGQIYDGLITSVTGYGFFVMLENTVEGLVRIARIPGDHYYYDRDRMRLVGELSGHTYQAGMKVKVQVLEADPEEGTIDFGIVRKNVKSAPARTTRRKRQVTVQRRKYHGRKK